MGMSNEKGLSNVLQGEFSCEEAMLQSEALPNLWILPAGSIPSNPTDLLSSPEMGKLLEVLRNRFEHVVLDSPPILLMTDATVLSILSDGVVLVVEGVPAEAERGLDEAVDVAARLMDEGRKKREAARSASRLTGVPTGAKTHTYADGPNGYTITVDLTDEDGTFTAAGTQAVTVDNVPPTITGSRTFSGQFVSRR